MRRFADTVSTVLAGCMVFLVVVLVAVGAATVITPPENHEPVITNPQVDCPAEDEVAVLILQDSFDLTEGEIHCVHIDVLQP